MDQGLPPQEPQQPQEGGASKAANEIHSKLSQFVQMVSQSDIADEDDLQKGAAVIEAFTAFIEGLGSAPGQKPQGAPQPGNLPPEAGAAAVKPAM